MNDKYYLFTGKCIAGEAPTPSSPPTLSDVGGKALSLIRTAALDFAVPEGFVLSVSFFHPWLEQMKKTKAWTSFLTKVDSDPESMTREDCDAIKIECKKKLRLNAEQRNYLSDAV